MLSQQHGNDCRCLVRKPVSFHGMCTRHDSTFQQKELRNWPKRKSFSSLHDSHALELGIRNARVIIPIARLAALERITSTSRFSDGRSLSKWKESSNSILHASRHPNLHRHVQWLGPKIVLVPATSGDRYSDLLLSSLSFFTYFSGYRTFIASASMRACA